MTARKRRQAEIFTKHRASWLSSKCTNPHNDQAPQQVQLREVHEEDTTPSWPTAVQIEIRVHFELVSKHDTLQVDVARTTAAT